MIEKLPINNRPLNLLAVQALRKLQPKKPRWDSETALHLHNLLFWALDEEMTLRTEGFPPMELAKIR